MPSRSAGPRPAPGSTNPTSAGDKVKYRNNSSRLISGNDRNCSYCSRENSEDLNAIKAKMNELKARDPGAFAADAIVVEVKEAAGGTEEAGGEVAPISGEIAIITARMKVIEKMVTDIGYRDKFAAGVYAGKIEGLMIGLIVSFALIGFMWMG